MKKTLFTILFISITLYNYGNEPTPKPQHIEHTEHNNEFRFTENKNQWHTSVKFRSQISGGYLYLRRTGFTFDFYDAKKIADLLGNHGGTLKKEKNNRLTSNYIVDETQTDDRTINCHLYNVNFLNANSNALLQPKNSAPHYSNYFKGNDKRYWASNVKSYDSIWYDNIYDGINLNVYYQNGNHKYDFIVQANSNPNSIELEYEGVSNLKIEYGNLYIKTSINQVIEQKPFAYQIIDGWKKIVRCNYVLKDSILGFEFPNGYNKGYELVIDPTLVFSTYSGSRSNNFGYTATYDNEGFLYSGSTSFEAWGLTPQDARAPNFLPFGLDTSFYPITPGAYQATYGGSGNSSQATNKFTFGVDIAISKFDTTGGSMIYSTFLGGNSDEMPHSLIVNNKNELIIFGTTGSSDFPYTSDAVDTTFAGGDTLDLTHGIATFFANGTDMFVSKLDVNGSNLLASTFYGGSENDGINDSYFDSINGTRPNKLTYNYADEVRGEVLLDKDENVYIVSSTNSTDLPFASNSSIQNTFGGGNQDGCIIKLTPNLDSVLWCTYFGGNDDDALYSVAIDDSNNIYVAGGSASNNINTTNTTPASHNYLNNTFHGDRDGIVAHIKGDGSSVINSKYFGTSNYDQIYFVETDGFNNVYLFGQSRNSGSNLIFNAGFSIANSGQFITKVKPSLDSLVWSTVFGSGSGRVNISPTAFLVDICNRVYIAGWGGTTNNNFNSATDFTNGMQITNDARQSNTDGSDFYLMSLLDDASAVDYGTYFGSDDADDHVDGGTSRFDKTGKIYQAVCASCGDDNTRFTTTPGAHSNTDNSTQVITTDRGNIPIHGCNLGVFKFDFDLPLILADFNTTDACLQDTNKFVNTSFNATTYEWSFGDGNTSNLTNPFNLYSRADTFNVKLRAGNLGTCNIADSITKQVIILSPQKTALTDSSICLGDDLQIGLNSRQGTTYDWDNGLTLSDSTISNPIASPIKNTNYVLVATALCPDTFTQNIEVINVQISPSLDTSYCVTTGAINLIANSNGTANTFVWSNFNTYTDTLNNPTSDSSASVSPNASQNYFVRASNKHCFKLDTVFVKHDSSRVIADFNNLVTTCNIDSVGFTNNSTNGTNFNWDFGDGNNSTLTNPKNLYSTEGNYTIILTATNPAMCINTDTASQPISIIEPSTTALTDTSLCIGSPIEIGTNTINGTTYNWNTGSTLSDSTISNPTANNTVHTEYTLIATSLCPDTFTQKVDVINVQLQKSNDTILCGNQDTIRLSAISNGTIVWSTTNDFSNILANSPNTSQLLSQNTTYYVRAKQQQCSKIDSVRGTVSNIVVVVNKPDLMCANDTLSIRAQNLNPIDAIKYTWTPSSTIISDTISDSIRVNPLQNTIYILQSINQNNCKQVDSIPIIVSQLPLTNMSVTASRDTIPLGVTTNLFGNPTGYEYKWTPSFSLNNDTIQNPIASPIAHTTYILEVSDNGSCVLSDSVRIYVFELICGEPNVFIANAFTPNKDGVNDYVFVRGNFLQEFKLEVFSRWGEKVFETTDKSIGWDGYHNGKLADPAVYDYYFTSICEGGEKFFKKGNITIIR